MKKLKFYEQMEPHHGLGLLSNGRCDIMSLPVELNRRLNMQGVKRLSKVMKEREER